MRPPATAIVDNLIWSSTGSVWAFYEVDPVPYAHRSDEDRMTVHRRIRSMLLGVPEHSVLLGLHEQIDPAEVVADMIDGVDLDRRPTWAESCAATLDVLAEDPLVKRIYLLGLRLPDTQASRFARILGSASMSVEESFGLGARKPKRAEVTARRRQASAAFARLGQLSATPASAGRLRWMYARACRRGLLEPTFDPVWEPQTRIVGAGDDATVDTGPLVQLLEADFAEGGLPRDPDRPRRPRYLRVETEHGVSFQTFLCVSDMPAHFSFPGGGGEWWRELEEIPWPVEWCLRLRSIDNDLSQRRVRRQHRQLIAQVDEYDGEVTGAPESLADAIDGIRAEGAELDANRAEREGQGTVVFCLASDGLDDLEERAAALTAMFEPLDYGLGRPTGGQLDLFKAFLPGSDTPPVARDYTQFLLSGSWAAGAPFTGAEVGDPTGMFLGASLDAGIEAPVLFDPAYGPTIKRSASVGVCGGLGGGKSYLAKRILFATVARGGQAVTVDRTQRAEYVAMADVMPGRSQVVVLGPNSTVCLDPLRMFGSRADRETFALGFLTLLTGVPTQSVEGDVLSEAVERVAGRTDARLADVVGELEAMADRTDRPDPEAHLVGRRIRSLATRRSAQVAFGDGDLLSLDDSDYIVFHAPGMVLPERDQLLNEHLAKQMLPEPIINLALLYLVAAAQRAVCFSNPGRFAMANFDEAHYLTASPQGEQLLTELVRDGRKHNAAAAIQSQSPEDFPAKLTQLLGPRFAFRQFPTAAEEAQLLLGLEPSDEVTALLCDDAEMQSGRCMFRDVRGRVCLLQVAPDPLPRIHAALDTNPSPTLAENADDVGPGAAAEELPPEAVILPTEEEPPTSNDLWDELLATRAPAADDADRPAPSRRRRRGTRQ